MAKTQRRMSTVLTRCKRAECRAAVTQQMVMDNVRVFEHTWAKIRKEVMRRPLYLPSFWSRLRWLFLGR